MPVRTSLVIASVLISASLSTIAARPDLRGHGVPNPTSTQVQPAKPVNDRCPIQGGEIDLETPTRTWRGHAIAFCCPGCDTKWDAKPDAEKDAFLAKFVKIAPPSPAADLARRFQVSMAAGDIEAIDRLFLGNGKASVLENGNDEGTWERYRDEHLKHELKDLAGYHWRTATESTTTLGSATLVSQAGTFATGEGSKKQSFSAALTFVVVDEGGTPKIAHLHWSSRRLAADRK